MRYFSLFRKTAWKEMLLKFKVKFVYYEVTQSSLQASVITHLLLSIFCVCKDNLLKSFWMPPCAVNTYSLIIKCFTPTYLSIHMQQRCVLSSVSELWALTLCVLCSTVCPIEFPSVLRDSLEVLILNDNQLECVPQSLCALHNLTELYLSKWVSLCVLCICHSESHI